MKKKFQILLLSLFCFTLGVSSLHADSIVVVRGQDFPPYHFSDEKGTVKGFVIEVLLQISETKDKEVVERIMQLKSVNEMVTEAL